MLVKRKNSRGKKSLTRFQAELTKEESDLLDEVVSLLKARSKADGIVRMCELVKKIQPLLAEGVEVYIRQEDQDLARVIIL